MSWNMLSNACKNCHDSDCDSCPHKHDNDYVYSPCDDCDDADCDSCPHRYE